MTARAAQTVTPERSAAPARSIWVAAVADVLGVLVFVALGRRSHDEGSGISAVLEVAAPFLIALAGGWVALRAWRRPIVVVPTGLGVWAVTVVVGLALRRTVFDRGIAVSFMVVTTLVLGALLVGWRALAGRRLS